MVPPPVEEVMNDDVFDAGVDVAEEPVQVKGASQTLFDYHPSLFLCICQEQKQVDNLSKMHSPYSQRLHVKYASQAINPFYTSHQSDHSRHSPP